MGKIINVFKNFLKKYRSRIITFLIDAVLTVAAFFIALFIVHSNAPSQTFSKYILMHLPICVGVVLIMFLIFDCYSGLLKYTGRMETMRMIMAYFVAALILIVLSFGISVLKLNLDFVYTFVVSGLLLSMAHRFFPWIIKYFGHMKKRFNNKPENRDNNLKRAIIYGAGSAGAYAISRFINDPEIGYDPVVVIDDDVNKHNMTLSTVKVIGGREKLKEAVTTYNSDAIIIAIENIKRSQLKSLYTECLKYNLPVKIMQTVDGKQINSEIKLADIKIEELLGRDEFQVRKELLDSCVKDKVILVTGGAGSIGSELCRQSLAFGCKHLIIFDAFENGLFDLDNELAKNYPQNRYTLVVGNIRDKAKLKNTFDIFKPNAVFHAAAYKHVPMMEINPLEAVKNNIFGTLNIIDQCEESKVDKLIFISTDKAVNPANIMGATKRIAEMMIQSRGKKSKVKMAAVRFGNVVGSNGSAIPFFLKQISEGGPVTVTHKDIKRYFMTIPEAVKLVLQAGAFATGGEVFVLDMGEPVYIYQLAEDLIRLSGYVPNDDIEIKIIGLRKGEKLFEELRFDDELCDRTSHEGIFITKLQDIDAVWLADNLKKLRDCVAAESDGCAEQIIFETVPSIYRETAPDGNETPDAPLNAGGYENGTHTAKA